MPVKNEGKCGLREPSFNTPSSRLLNFAAQGELLM